MKTTLVTGLVWLLASAPFAGAQLSTGTVTGRVVDPQGAAMPGATVTARNPATGFSRTETTDTGGIYRLAALPVATYEVTVEMPGFTSLIRKNVEVYVAQTNTIDFRPAIGTIEEVVTVRAAEIITSTVGDVVDPRRVQELPINGRQFANLAATLPG